MTNPPPGFRPLTQTEIEQIIDRIEYQDRIDFDWLKETILRLFGPAAAKVKLLYGCEYDDGSSYDWRCREIIVTDAAGAELPVPTNLPKDQWGDTEWDNLPRSSNLSPGSCASDDESLEIEHDLRGRAPELSSLFVWEPITL